MYAVVYVLTGANEWIDTETIDSVAISINNNPRHRTINTETMACIYEYKNE